MAGTDKALEWGFEPYNVPVEDWQINVQNHKFSKSKREIKFLEDALRFKKLPAPNLYQKPEDWMTQLPKKRG